LAISEKMRGQIRGLKQAQRNAQDGISLIQTAEGALNETHAILQRMRELAVQAANDTNIEQDRDEIQKEVDELAKEITRIANNTEFNTQTLVNGGISESGLGSNKFHIGANKGQHIELSIKAMDAKSLGVARDVVSAELADGAEGVTDVAIGTSRGSALVDGASIDVSAEEIEATSGSLSAAYTAATGDLVLEIDGHEVTVALLESDDASAAAGKINDAIADVLGVEGTYAEVDGNTITISSLTTGSSSSVAVTGALAGFTVGSDSGSDASYTVTLTDETTSVNITGLTGTETTISGTGVFAGLTLTTDGAFDEDLEATITITLKEAAAATFANGETTAAVTEAGIDVSSQTAASNAIEIIDEAIKQVSAERSMLGAYQNRLEHTIANLGTSAENLQAAESRIRDLDMAEEIMAFTKNNILQQAATAMLAQANMAPQSVLQLLG